MMSSDNDWQPLYLSSIAGASTCIGAAVVFCQPKEGVPPGMMAFSLSLAGSVMVTVSVISIIPECLKDDSEEVEASGSEGEGESYKMIPIFSHLMFWRIVFFGFGAALYFILSWFLTEPEELLHSSDFNVLVGTKNTTTSNHSRTHDLTDDYDEGNDNMELQALNQNAAETKPFLNETNVTAADIEASISIAGTNKVYKRDQHARNRASPTTPKLNAHNKNGEWESVVSTYSTGDMENDISSPVLSPILQQSRSYSPGNNNGKIKKASPSNGHSKGLREWTTGKDLDSKEQQKAWRVAMLLFVSLLVHNFPEGLAVAASALESKSLGITVTVGIMIHNIPEGIAIAIPCLAARPDQPWLSFLLASVSGLAEPLGAFVALIFLRGVENSGNQNGIISLENILAFVAGIMIFVALWELFPEAKRHTKEGWTCYWFGTVSGVVIMVITELYLP